MTITDGSLRSNVFTDLKSFLSSANLTASDVTNSSIPVSLVGMYNNKKNTLPVMAISNPQVSSGDKIAFDTGFNSQKNIFVSLDIYSKVNAHLDQISDQVASALQSSSISGLSLIGWDEDYELQEPADNVVYHKALFLTFQRW